MTRILFYVATIAFVSSLAVGSYCQAEVPFDVAGHRYGLGQVRAEVDIGIVDEDREPVPEGKADVLVVLSGTWCIPCQSMKPTWARLRAQGYKVVYIDVDDRTKGNEDNSALVEKYMDKYRQKLPAIFWHNSDTNETVKEHKYRVVTAREVKKTLWKPESDAESVPSKDKRLRVLFD